MKRIVAFVLCAILVFSLAACHNEESELSEVLSEGLENDAFSDGEITTPAGSAASCEIGSLKGYSYRITQSPIFGSLTLNESGKLEYKAMKGYVGNDNVKITVYDGVSEYKTIEVKITVTE